MRELGVASRIGAYQLVAPIGAGGMGKVWVALDTAAPAVRLVAIKTALSEGGGSGGNFWAMLSDEATLASRINHPNVCATYDLGDHEGTHFLVMEWSDGASLRDVLDAAEGKRLSPELAAFIGSSVAAGLHAAHELTDEHGALLGVVHRDVSPQNILISLRGHVRLADFGVAKARGQQHQPTETGEVKGKLSYMAPEQITSKLLDRRADVFALGCVLYEATLGVRPFHGADAMATMYKILETELVPPRAMDPSFPEELERVLLKALTKAPEARYATADELRAALVEFLSSTRRVFTDKLVAGLFKDALGQRLTERNRAIYTTAEQIRRGETDAKRLRSPPPPAPTRTLTPDGGVERSVKLMRPRGAAPSKRWLVWGAGAALALAVLVGIRRTAYDPTQLEPAPSRVSQAAPASAPTAPSPPALPSVTTQPVTPSAPTLSASPAIVKVTRGARGAPSRLAVPSAQLAVGSKAPAKPRPIDRDNPFATP